MRTRWSESLAFVAVLSVMVIACSDSATDNDSTTAGHDSGGSTSTVNPSGGGDEGGGGSPMTTASGGNGGGGSTSTDGGGGEGGEPSSGGAGGEGGASTSSGGGGEGGEGGGEPIDLNCSGWTRDVSFDALKIDGLDIQLVGGITGSSANNLFVSIATYNKAAIGHWDGSAWNYEALPSAPLVPQGIGGIWTSPNGTVYAAGKDINASRLFIRTGGVWTNAPNEPSTIEMVDVTGVSDTNVWILGQDAGFGRIWRKNGSNWVEQDLPDSLPFPQRMMRIWALDAGNVFATGYTLDANSDPDGGFLLHFDGTSWEEISVPGDNRQINAIHGTSINDLFITGQKSSGEGVVYHMTNSMTIMEEYADAQVDLYYPVWSKGTGAVLAGGVVPPGTSGSMRTTVDSMMSFPTTSAVDGIATHPVAFWPDPNSDIVHLVHASNGVISGHYTVNCSN